MKSTNRYQSTGARYERPCIERIDVVVEQGFALTENSVGGNGNEGLFPGGEGGWDD